MFVHSPALQHQVGSQQPGFRRQEAPDQCAGDVVGRARHHPKWPSRPPEGENVCFRYPDIFLGKP